MANKPMFSEEELEKGHQDTLRMAREQLAESEKEKNSVDKKIKSPSMFDKDASSTPEYQKTIGEDVERNKKALDTLSHYNRHKEYR